MRVPHWVNWMQTQTQNPNPGPVTGQTQTPVMGENTEEVPQIYKDLLATVKKYVRLHHNDLKELSDLWLTIANFIETAKKTMGYAWYENHKDMTLHDLLIERLMWSGKAVFHCPEYVEIRNCVEERADEILDDVLHDPKHDLIIDLLMDLKYWGLESLTFREIETINTIINDVIGYCMERGYGPDDSLDDCFSTGDDA